MEIETDDNLIQVCLKKIEHQLGWGSGDEWSTQDFESLSKKIQAGTGVTLSVATLKRIWGKIRYDSKPTVTTLNTLAQFVGYENWRTFKQKHALNGSTNGHGKKETVSPVVDQHDLPKEVKSRTWIYMAASVIIVAVAVTYFLLIRDNEESATLDPSRFKFSSKKVVDEGVPNTVIFDYDASTASPTDSVFIQQSWDARLSTLVSRDEKQHTSIYYYPGFFDAKLRINQTVVQRHDLIITTDGWLPLIDQKPVPVYFKEDDGMRNGSFGLGIDQITSANIPLQPSPPRVAYYNVQDYGEVTTHDLVFETAFKNEYAEGANACQFTDISILFNGGALIVPLSSKGCVSELKFMDLDGKKNDLSVLGCDFSEWVNFKILFQPDSFKVQVNNNQLGFSLKSNPIKMVGIVYKFQGTGSVDFVRVTNHAGEIFYEEEFN